jgi:hypothetical protein
MREGKGIGGRDKVVGLEQSLDYNSSVTRYFSFQKM